MKSLEEWYDELVQLAKAQGVAWLLSDSAEDHREGYEDGLTPEEELQEQTGAASSRKGRRGGS